MKERPILFSGQMVCAILDGRKTQTRRLVKPQPHAGVRKSPFVSSGIEDGHGRELRSPHGEPGDRLWVRENFRIGEDLGEGWEPGMYDVDRCVIYDADQYCDYIVPDEYQAPRNAKESHDDEGTLEHHRSFGPIPSIFMPRWASRISLEIIDIRVERLQDISYEDAIAEGMFDASQFQKFPHTDRETPEQFARRLDRPQRDFMDTWESINGAGSWATNPWVWVIAFRRIAS